MPVVEVFKTHILVVWRKNLLKIYNNANNNKINKINNAFELFDLWSNKLAVLKIIESPRLLRMKSLDFFCTRLDYNFFEIHLMTNKDLEFRSSSKKAAYNV